MRRLAFFVLLLSLLSVSGAHAATNNTANVTAPPIADPLEPLNRAIFQFNRGVDYLVLNPAATAYKYALPGFVRTSIGAFLSNLSAPISALNELLQGDFHNFDITLRRFVVNSTLGIAGVIDVASYHGLPEVSREDFGQTMAKWGAGHGFYFVMPVLGSTSLRDGTGRLADSVADPFNAIWRDSETEWPIYTRIGLTILDTRAQIGDNYNDIMNNAVDPYVTFRSIYAQNRNYLVQDQTVDSYEQAEVSE